MGVARLLLRDGPQAAAGYNQETPVGPKRLVMAAISEQFDEFSDNLQDLQAFVILESSGTVSSLPTGTLAGSIASLNVQPPKS